MEYLKHAFVWKALIVGVLIALCSSLLGVTLVLKRFSYIGDGLSHVAFGAMAVASVLKMTNQMFLIIPVTILCAILLLRTGQNAKIKGDAAVAMISVGALAFGYLVMNVFSASANISGDVCSTLFGSTSILTLSMTDVWLSVALSIAVVVIFILFYHKIFAVTFDENFAKASGIRTNAYNLLIAVVIALVIVLAMNLVGSLLISALVIFPALSAMRIFRSFRSVTIASAILSVTSALFGMLFSILIGTPVGSAIVATDVVVFALCWVIGSARGRIAVALLSMALVLGLGSCGNASMVKQTGPVSSTSSVKDVLQAQIEKENASEEEKKESEPIEVTEEEQKETQSQKQAESSAEETNAALEGSAAETLTADVDLTVMSSTMIYSEVYNMMYEPSDYVGKVIKIEGQYAVAEADGTRYDLCVIKDATACCAQGMEFVLTEDYVYPDAYPEVGSEIVLIGTFDTYWEGEYMYCTLRNAVLLSAS